MPLSFKNFINKQQNSTSGIITFNGKPTITISNRSGRTVSSYTDLEEIPLSDEEREFSRKNWAKIKEKHPTFYDGDVTAIIDVIYDQSSNNLTFRMDKAKYSQTCAMGHQEYPSKQRSTEFVSFGMGLMTNLKIGSDESLLMVERSNKVLTEKGAVSVPGGSMEYKEGKSDDIQKGLDMAAFNELIEEVLGDKYFSKKFSINIKSLSWNVDANSKSSVNTYFGVEANQTITRSDLRESFKVAKDREESTGNFFFVDTSVNIGKSGESNSHSSPQDIVDLGIDKLQKSGTFALTTQAYQDTIDAYERGVYSGNAPHPSSFAKPFENFSIFNIAQFENTIPMSPKPSPTNIKTTEKLTQQVTQAKNDVPSNSSAVTR